MSEDVGSFAEEAARLAGAAQAWARGETPGRGSSTAGHLATGDPACCVCPVCQVIVLLRGERPELTARLLESVTGLVLAGQGLVDTLTAVAAQSRAAGDGAAGRSAQDNGAQDDGAQDNGAQDNGAQDNGAQDNGAPGEGAAGNGGTDAAGNGRPARVVQNIVLD